MIPIASALPSQASWRLPIAGQVADEPLPSWLVERIQDYTITINSLGGFTIRDIEDPRSCMGGDLVVLRSDNTIAFAA